MLGHICKIRGVRRNPSNVAASFRLKSVAVDHELHALSNQKIDVNPFSPTDPFLHRHMGSVGADRDALLEVCGFKTMEELIDSTLPPQIRLPENLVLDQPMGETEALELLQSIMSKNQVLKSFIGMGYHETKIPLVILRNVLENPGWYTAYTPYQAEISQGRLQSLLNFQTMVAELTAMPLSNASLLDEATAAAEAMTMTYSLQNQKKKKFYIDERCHPQNIALCQTRGDALGMEVEVGPIENVDMSGKTYCGVLIQYPDTYGTVKDWSEFTATAKSTKTMVVAATDLMASTILKPVGEMGADIAVGSAQRFGVPMGFGGPHAGFLATNEKYSRKMAGRIIGVTIDSEGKPALRMAMQTREQHIRRDKATSNICTAQALLANIAAFYGVYHGPEGLKEIASKIHGTTTLIADTLESTGKYDITNEAYFDTISIDVSKSGNTAQGIADAAVTAGVNVRVISPTEVGVSVGEGIKKSDVEALISAFGIEANKMMDINGATFRFSDEIKRTTDFMTHPNFNTYHSETKMLRYLKHLENKDLSLNTSMISLGSCTMKLNSTSEMIPVTWNETANLHPFAPPDQTKGYIEMMADLNNDLAKITGFAAVSAQPNSGAQGEYSGLLCIKKYLESKGEGHRDICLIPVSAHGTNPASANMCGLKVVVIKSDEMGNIDLADFKEKCAEHRDKLAALMITYPSTYGVFEEDVMEIINEVHDCGGQVYMDGANMNAQVGLTSPGFIGADVCHLNLHKTFCIPHGGGGPGVGSIGVAKHLAPFLPGHPVIPTGGDGENVVPKTTGAIAAAPFGSAAILPISWMYIKMLGEPGLREATGMAILNANYMAKKIGTEYPVLYTGKNGDVAHEFIIDLRDFKQYGIVEEDIAKRLQDYGFHSPTMSWPVGGTIMVEPTESEDKPELDRFCDAMLMIRKEIQDVIDGNIAYEDSPLKLSPHTMEMVTAETWDRKYSRKEAAFPAPWTKRDSKFWPTVGRVDNVYGDRNLVCSCPPLEDYM